jgi:hypothetical protein
MQAGRSPQRGPPRLAVSRSTSKLTHYRTGLDLLFSWPPLPLTLGNGHCRPSARDRQLPAVAGLPGAARRGHASFPHRPFQYAQASSAPAKSQPELPVTRGHGRGADAIIARSDRLGVRYHSLCCPVAGRPASPRKSHSKSQRRPTSGGVSRRRASVCAVQVPGEPCQATPGDVREVTGVKGSPVQIRPSRLVVKFFRIYFHLPRASKRAIFL